MVEHKRMSEMTKLEIYKEIRFNNKTLKKMGDEVDWIRYYTYSDSNRLFRQELKDGGSLSINDRAIIDCSANIEWAAMKRIEKTENSI